MIPLTLKPSHTTPDTAEITFPYQPDMVQEIKKLPGAQWDKTTKTWEAPLTKQLADTIRNLHANKHCRATIAPGMDPTDWPDATNGLVRKTRDGLGYTATIPGGKSNPVWHTLHNLNGARSKYNTIHIPAAQKKTIKRITEENHIPATTHCWDEPEGVTLTWDHTKGVMLIEGDKAIKTAIHKHWPERNPVDKLANQGITINFANHLTQQIYYGEIYKHTPPELNIPGLKATLHPYQRSTVAAALVHDGFGGFLSPGLGKTLVGIAAGMKAMETGNVNRCVVIVPTYLARTWEKEIATFAPEETPHVARAAGQTKQKREEILASAEKKRWIIISQDSLGADLDAIKTLTTGAYIIVDEAHRLSKISSQRTKTFLNIARKHPAKTLLLSGTPINNDLTEWWTLFQAINPHILGDLKNFRNTYMLPQWGSGGRGYEGHKNLPELHRRTQPFFARYTKKQLPNLPPIKIITNTITPPPHYQKALHIAQQQAKEAIEQGMCGGATPTLWYSDDAPTNANPAALAAVTAMRALLTSPRLLQQSDSISAEQMSNYGLVPNENGPKVQEIINIATSAQKHGKRILYFTYSTTMVELLSEELTQHNIPHVTYTGDMTGKEKEQAEDAFTGEGPNPPVAMLATDAAAEGLNLSAHCNIVVNIDMPWTPGRLEQRINRIHRANSSHDTYIAINLITANSLEQHFTDIIDGKKTLSDAILGDINPQQLTKTTKTNKNQYTLDMLTALNKTT